MSLVQFSTPVSNANDTTFRAWGLELSTNLQAAGLSKQVDTGQINWATVVKPVATNTSAGYEIYSLNDGYLPIFIKIEYGTNTSATNPQIWITVGQSSNGAGTLTGTTSNRGTICITSGWINDGSSYPTNIYVGTGVFWLAWKMGATGATSKGAGLIAIGRSVDTAGAITTEHVYIYRNLTASVNYHAVQVIDRTRNVAYSESSNGAQAVIPQGVDGTAVTIAGITRWQPILHNLSTPEFRAPFFAVTVLTSEVVRGDTFVFAPVGNVDHTFLSLGTAGNYSCLGGNTGGTTNCLALVCD